MPLPWDSHIQICKTIDSKIQPNYNQHHNLSSKLTKTSKSNSTEIRNTKNLKTGNTSNENPKVRLRDRIKQGIDQAKKLNVT